MFGRRGAGSKGWYPKYHNCPPSPTARHRTGWRAPRRSRINDTLTWVVNVWRPFYSISLFSVKVIPQYRKAEIQLGKQKKLPQIIFSVSKKKTRKHVHSPVQALGKTKEPLHSCINRARCHFKGAEEGRKRFQCRVVFSSLC